MNDRCRVYLLHDVQAIDTGRRVQVKLRDLLLDRYQPLSPFPAFAASDQKCYHRSSALFRMHGSESQQQVVPNSYVEGGLRQQLSGSPAASAYQGFLPAEMESSRSVDNLHSPPEPAGSSYSSPVFLSVSYPACLKCLLVSVVLYLR
jgi:hypothetical protein